MMKVLLSLRFSDARETLAGFRAVLKTLGFGRGLKAFLYATMKQTAALWRGEGSYPERGKRRIWFKFNFLRYIYDYLLLHFDDALEKFDGIIGETSISFIGQYVPPSRLFSREFVLHSIWPQFITRDYNIVAEADPPEGNSVSLRVHRCFINEVVRDVGLMPVGDRICNGDFIFWEKYHPKVGFSRAKTLIRGDEICNHTVTWLE
jgi:hypothetical protein